MGFSNLFTAQRARGNSDCRREEDIEESIGGILSNIKYQSSHGKSKSITVSRLTGQQIIDLKFLGYSVSVTPFNTYEVRW